MIKQIVRNAEEAHFMINCIKVDVVLTRPVNNVVKIIIESTDVDLLNNIREELFRRIIRKRKHIHYSDEMKTKLNNLKLEWITKPENHSLFLLRKLQIDYCIK